MSKQLTFSGFAPTPRNLLDTPTAILEDEVLEAYGYAPEEGVGPIVGENVPVYDIPGATDEGEVIFQILAPGKPIGGLHIGALRPAPTFREMLDDGRFVADIKKREAIARHLAEQSEAYSELLLGTQKGF